MGMTYLRQTDWSKFLFALSVFVMGVISHSAQGMAEGGFENFQNEHRSLLKIERVARGGETRHVKIGLNKSLVVELPRDVRDVLVSNPEFIDAVLHSSRRAYLIGKKIGEGNAFFFDKDGNRILTIEISISRDMSALSGMYKRILRDSKVKVDMVNEHIVLTGSVRTPGDATKAADIAARFVKSKEQVINLLTSSGNEQVNLQVKVVEIKRSVAKRLGVNVEAFTSGNGISFSNFTDLAFPNSLTPLASGLNALGLAVAPNADVGLKSQFKYQNGSSGVGAAVRALEDNGILRTLAEPNLTSVSGETANFLAGGEFPIPVANDDDGLKISFKPFGIGLAFTPVVMNERLINLKISTEVSDISTRGAITLSAISIPAIEVRRASTTVELGSGGSIVIAGLISDATRHNIKDVPGLKRLPVLGSLFRSREFQRDESELVIIVTPYIVRSTALNKLTTPDQGLGLPSDRKAFFKGHLNKYDRHKRAPVRRVAREKVREEQWSLKDVFKAEPAPRRRERSWARRSRHNDDGLGFIVE